MGNREMPEDLRLVIDQYLAARTQLVLGGPTTTPADAMLAEVALRRFWETHPGTVWDDAFEEEMYWSIDQVVRELDSRAEEHAAMIQDAERRGTWE